MTTLGLPGLVHAPWLEDEVQSLNDYQNAGFVHPFTGPSGGILIATKDGWIEKPGGPIVQDWAHKFMTNGSWRQFTWILDRV